MKSLIGAIALTFGAPLAAQTADPHAGHAQHQQHGQSGTHQQGQSSEEQHKDCCKMVNGKMECQMMKGAAQPKDAPKDRAH